MIKNIDEKSLLICNGINSLVIKKKMNLNNVYLPHFCRPCYHKNNLMDLIVLLIAHFVLQTFVNTGFVLCGTLDSSNAQSKTNSNHHHHIAVMPTKSVSYELTVVHDPSTGDRNQTHSNRTTYATKAPTKTNELSDLDRLSQEQINQLNQVKYLNQLNKVNIMNHINQQNLQELKTQINQFNQIENQQQFDERNLTDQATKQPTKQHNEIRDGFVVLTSAHNSKYPGPMHSRNVLSQAGGSIPSDFYQKYHTSTSTVTIRPIVKEYHQQMNAQNYEQISQKINEKTNENFDEKFDVKTYDNLNGSSSNFLGNTAFLPDDKPEADLNADDEHKELVSEFVDNLKNTNKDDGNSKSFFELFGNGITSHNPYANTSSVYTAKPTPENDHLQSSPKPQTPVDQLFDHSTMDTNSVSSTNMPTVFDLMAEDTNYRPSISNDNMNGNRLKAHGTRPGQPLTTYELFKEYPLINNSNIIINQFHSTPNWTKPDTNANRNQTKIISINPITRRPTVHLPTELSFLHSFLANYSSFNPTSFNKPVVITEFANDFLTNLTSSSSSTSMNDLDDSDSSRITFFNTSSSTTTTTTTQPPILENLDKNQFDVPLSPHWDLVANQLTSTTLSPLPLFHVSSSDLVTKRNQTLSRFPFKQHPSSTIHPNYLYDNNTLHMIPSTNVPYHHHHLFNEFHLPSPTTPSSVLYSATQSSSSNPFLSPYNNYVNNSSTIATTVHTSTSRPTTSTLTPNVYKYVAPPATRQPPSAIYLDHNFTTYTNNHNFDESIHYNNPLKLATNPKLIQPLTLLVMSYLASKSSIGANLITRNDQPSNTTAASNGGLVDWLRFSGRRNRKRNKSATRSNKQVNRQQKQRNTSSSSSNSKTSSVNSLPLAALSNLQVRPITLEDIIISNHLNSQLAGANSLAQQTAFPASTLNAIANPFLYPSTRSPSLSTSRVPQMIFETKRQRPSSSYIPEEFLTDNGFTADDYEEEIRALLENPLADLRLNSKLMNTDAKQSNGKNSANSMYRTHRNGQSSTSSRNSRTPISQPPESSGSSGNINTPTGHSLIENDLSGHSTNTPAPRCDRFSDFICVDDFEYPETAILEEIDRKRHLFQLLYSEVKGEMSQVDGLSRSQEQALSWEHQFGSNNYLNDSSNESSFSSSNNSPNRNSYITMDDDMLNNEKTSYRFNSLIKDTTKSSKSSGFICSSEILYGRPKLAKNVKGQWKVIVNAGQYTQTVRMEKCLQPNKGCSFVQSAASAVGATSRCAQVNAFHRLMVFEKGKGFYIDTFRIPSSCACYVQHKNKAASNSDQEFDSDEIGNNHYNKLNRKRIDSQPTIRDRTEIDRQTSNRLQNQGVSLPSSILNQQFILNELNGFQRNKLQTLLPTFGQRISSTLNNANSLVNTKLQQPAVELRPLYLKNGGTLLASLFPLVNNNDKNGNLNGSNLIEKLSISGTLNPALLEQQQRELNQLVLDLIKLNTNTPKTLAERSKIISLEDLIRSQLSLAQITPNNLLEQLNSALFTTNQLNDLTKTVNRRKNTSSRSDLLNALTSISTNNRLNNNNSNNQKLGLLYLDDSTNDKHLKTNLKGLPIVKLVQMPQLNNNNNQIVYGQRFVDKRKSNIAQLLMANKSNYSNLLDNGLLNGNLLKGNLLNKTPLIVPRDALNLETPISALKIITPDNLITQSPVQPTSEPKDSAKEKAKDDESSDEDDEDDEKIVDEIDVGNLLGKHIY